ncbi:MAG: L-rhamnose mutarotase [Treponema sp.]|jgi:L-rhamnose mutarotase|nr:L-rhamnose mutarotase [Treponema sp.]
MKRKAFIMHLHRGAEAEYKRRHDAIWPELEEEIHRAGISDYSIFLDPKTNILFAYQILADDAGDGDKALASRGIVKKWWHMMKDIMDTNPDESPVSEELTEMFHLD